MKGPAAAGPPPLRVMTCGSVDDGKSTLIGRLLHDAALVPDDQLVQAAEASRRHGTTGEDTDLALLLDGLEAEREQGITIDVAYRYATTPRRRLVIADAPGHEQYTRNMAVAASQSDAAVVLVDARRGAVAQTLRHSAIAALMGVRHVVLAVNKVDLAGYDAGRFRAVAEGYAAAVADAGFRSVVAIPLSALRGDNVGWGRSPYMPWYGGPTLLECLEGLDADAADADAARPFRMPVQWVNRPHAGFRGYAGTVAAGVVRPGSAVSVSGGGGAKRRTTVRRIVMLEGDLPEARAGDAVTLVLADELDVSRGDVLADAAAPVEEADQFAAQLVWLNEAPLLPGRALLCKLGTRTVPGSVTSIRYRIDVETREHLAAPTIGLNDIAKVHLSLASPVAYAPYAESRELGGFILIDRQTNATAGVGMIDFALTRAANVAWQATSVDRRARAAVKGQRPAVVWFTGLSGAGKSTIADLVDRRLHAMGHHAYLLDGDNVRHGLNRDLGFTEADRVENIRRAGEVAALFADAGLIVLASFISPYRAERQAARELLPEGEFLEAFVDTPVEECRRRDPKGLYAKADAGRIPNFTGVSAPYEPPVRPDLHLRTLGCTPQELADQVVAELAKRGFFDAKVD